MDDRSQLPPRSSFANEIREPLTSVRWIGRIAWFALGAVVGVGATFAFVVRPAQHVPERAAPFELFPFADNAGVCQEHVALAALQTSYADARATVQRLLPALPSEVNADNLRVVRALVPGDFFTIAVDAQPGSGDAEGASRIATAMNAVPGTGVRFEPVFYSSRRLYETAHLLCMPRQQSAPTH